VTPPDPPQVGVTAVVATRDRPQLLRKAVEAVLAQDYAGPIEVIAVFDQAEPEPDLERDDGLRTVRVLRNDRTPGLPGARNTGILAAAHPLIAFCDDDDRWLPGKLPEQVAELDRQDANAAITGIRVLYGDTVRDRVLAEPRLTHADLIRNRLTEAHPSTFLARRDFVLEQAGLVDETIPGGYGEDYDWLLRVARHGDVAVVREPLVEILWHPGSFFTRRWDTIVDALDYLLAQHPEFAGDRRGLARIEGQQAFALAALGRRREGWRKLRDTLRHNPLERRALVTVPVLLGVVSAGRLLHTANRFGRGI